MSLSKTDKSNMPYWYYDKETLRDSPSIQDGMDYQTECSYRKDGAQLIKNICTEMDLGIYTAATGVMYFHRFYIMHSFNKFPRYVTACCCLFLAGKAEETPKKCKDIIKIAEKFLNKEDFLTFGSNPKEQVMTLEKILLTTIRFDLKVQHPYKFLIMYVKYLKEHEKKLAQVVNMAWIFINDSLSTTLPLQWEPEIIAIAVIHLAAKLRRLNLFDWRKKKSHHLVWWDNFVEDLSKEVVEDICHQILDIYAPFPNQSQPNYHFNKLISNNQVNEANDSQLNVKRKSQTEADDECNLLDKNENIVNVKKLSHSINSSPCVSATTLPPTDPRVEFSIACGYHVYSEHKMEAEKVTSSYTPKLEPASVSSEFSSTPLLQSSKHNFMNTTESIRNPNSEIEQKDKYKFNQGRVNDFKQGDSRRKMDSYLDQNNERKSFIHNNNKVFACRQRNNKFGDFNRNSYQQRNNKYDNSNQNGYQPMKRGFGNSDDSTEDREIDQNLFNKSFNRDFSKENFKFDDNKLGPHKDRGFNCGNASPPFNNRRFNNKYNNGFHKNHSSGQRNNNGFLNRGRGSYRRFSGRRGFIQKKTWSESRNFHHDSSSGSDYQDPKNNIVSEGFGFNSFSPNNQNFRNNISPKNVSFKNCPSLFNSNNINIIVDESWSPEDQEQKKETASASPGVNGRENSTKNDVPQSPENRDPRLLSQKQLNS